jgi:thioredoxin
MKKTLLLLAILCANLGFAKVQVLSDEDFNTSIQKGWAVVDFFTDWCGPCKAFGPVFEAASNQFEGKVLFAKVNGTQKNTLLDRFHVTSIPTIILFKDGKEVKRNVGPMKPDQLTQWIQAATRS